MTYNLQIRAFDYSDGDREKLAAWPALRTDGHELLVAGESRRLHDGDLLCTGEVGQCPTDPRVKAPHQCDGVLARFAGHDLYWLACTGFELPGQRGLGTVAALVGGPQVHADRVSRRQPPGRLDQHRTTTAAQVQ